jgi:hypothetical protein
VTVPLRLLRISTLVELFSLIMLLANLATVHWPPVAALLGPVHGCAYLFVIGSTVSVTRNPRTRLAAVVPAIGGLLVLRRIGSGRAGGDVSMSATGR